MDISGGLKRDKEFLLQKYKPVYHLSRVVVTLLFQIEKISKILHLSY